MIACPECKIVDCECRKSTWPHGRKRWFCDKCGQVGSQYSTTTVAGKVEWWCSDCLSPASAVYFDKTDELLAKNFTGKSRDMLRASHRKEALINQKKYKRTL